ncbi:TolC family protein [Cyanobium sp. AMD-g]|uniref:TolC family protein n=1 Tax=Cyanobium sp. AMD-g TaxID=2823699 RepID=UPI0020CEAEA1|nr:TolC family protein [Cyanobium sp. AMD-g]MCP9930946.1 TolC family protein [Cyanobium sp. AMD-g]
MKRRSICQAHGPSMLLSLSVHLTPLALVASVGPMALPPPARAQSLPASVSPPEVKDVEALGAGWPGPMPTDDRLPALPPELLGVLTMEQAAAWAVARNPVVRSAYQSLVATQNSLGAAYASWWPTLNLSLNGGPYASKTFYNYPFSASAGFPITGSGLGSERVFEASYFQAIGQVDATWNLIDPTRSATIWQNKYLVRQAADTYVITRRDQRLKTQSAFIDLQRAVAAVKTGREIVENDELLYRLAQTRVQMGVASKLEVFKQQTVLLADRQALLAAEQQVETARANLAQLLATPSPDALSPASPLTPLGAWGHALDDTIHASLAYRKVLEQQLLAIQTNEAQARIYLATYRPTLQLITSLYWTKGVGYLTQGPPFVPDARSDAWNGSALLQLTFTGFDGGQARMNAAAARRQAAAAAETYSATVLQVRSDVQSLVAQARSGRSIVMAGADRVKAANGALRLQTMRFNAGYGTITDVVQAQQEISQAVSSYIQNLATYNDTLVQLSRSSGLPVQPDPALLEAVGNPLQTLRLPTRMAQMR